MFDKKVFSLKKLVDNISNHYMQVDLLKNLEAERGSKIIKYDISCNLKTDKISISMVVEDATGEREILKRKFDMEEVRKLVVES